MSEQRDAYRRGADEVDAAIKFARRQVLAIVAHAIRNGQSMERLRFRLSTSPLLPPSGDTAHDEAIVLKQERGDV